MSIRSAETLFDEVDDAQVLRVREALSADAEVETFAVIGRTSVDADPGRAVFLAAPVRPLDDTGLRTLAARLFSGLAGVTISEPNVRLRGACVVQIAADAAMAIAVYLYPDMHRAALAADRVRTAAMEQRIFSTLPAVGFSPALLAA